MDKEFEIQGRVDGLPPELVGKVFLNALIDFVEKKGWLFGGVIKQEKISGCVYGTPPEMAEDQFKEAFLNFVKQNGWTFTGSVSLLIDGEHV